MAVKQSQSEKDILYFCTFTCYDWLPLIELVKAYDAVYKWFEYLEKYDNKVAGYVIMPNHVHVLLYISPKSPLINTILSNAKRFLAYEIVARLKAKQEKWYLEQLAAGVTSSDRKRGKLHQVFQPSSDIKACATEHRIAQKLHYMHNNPVSGKWNLAATFWDYPHSSARWYELQEHAAYPVVDYRDIWIGEDFD